MKHLTLTLLLSIAPAALNAECKPCLLDVAPQMIADVNKCNSCDRTEQIQDERCCGLAELVLIDAEEAFDKITVTVTISGENVTAEGWEFINNYVPTVYGEATTTKADSVSWVFARGDRSLAEWFTYLSAVEAIFVAVRSTVTSMTADAAAVTLQLN